MHDIQNQIREIMADIFNVSPQIIDESSSPETIESWDSLQHLNLVLALEESFGIQFSIEEIQSMRSFLTVLETVENRLSPAFTVEC
ncbi:MAG: acyl carrier protein [bacterium]